MMTGWLTELVAIAALYKQNAASVIRKTTNAALHIRLYFRNCCCSVLFMYSAEIYPHPDGAGHNHLNAPDSIYTMLTMKNELCHLLNWLI